jgi:hypothetical protein
MPNICSCKNMSFNYQIPVISAGYRKPIFSNNSLVFYKENSSPGNTAGTVVNSRAVARRT